MEKKPSEPLRARAIARQRATRLLRSLLCHQTVQRSRARRGTWIPAIAAGPSPAECSSACVPRSESTGEERTKTNFFPRQGVEKTHLGRSGSRQVKNKLRIAFYGSGEEGLPRSGERVLGIDVRVSRGPASAAHAPATQKPKPNNPVDLVVRPTLSILLVKTDEACVHVCVRERERDNRPLRCARKSVGPRSGRPDTALERRRALSLYVSFFFFRGAA